MSLAGRKDFLEGSRGVKLLEPLGVLDAGLFAAHAFDVTGVDQIEVDGLKRSGCRRG